MDDQYTVDEISIAARKVVRTEGLIGLGDLIAELTKPPERKLLPDRPVIFNVAGIVYTNLFGRLDQPNDATNIRALFTEDEVMRSANDLWNLDDVAEMDYTETWDWWTARLDVIKYGEEI